MLGKPDIPFASSPDPPKSTEGLVWMVQGDERPFFDSEASLRPWLEESVEWASPSRSDSSSAHDEPDADGLLWI